jgi:hypothetical protein
MAYTEFSSCEIFISQENSKKLDRFRFFNTPSKIDFYITLKNNDFYKTYQIVVTKTIKCLHSYLRMSPMDPNKSSMGSSNAK